MFYSFTYLLYDVFSKKSLNAFYYMQLLYLVHFIFRYTISTKMNQIINIVSWILQIIGHKIFEKNNPALLDNLYDSFLFAPYFTFVETFYPSFETNTKNKYTIIHNNYDPTKKSIIYFAGLFQRSQIEYEKIASELLDYNHIYINTNFCNNDKWYMIKNYPTYQNNNNLSDKDYLIVSDDDIIHTPLKMKTHNNLFKIVIKI
jgi:hypothetical protein